MIILMEGNFVLSNSPTLTGTVTASQITSPASTNFYIDVSAGTSAGTIVGYNTPKYTSGTRVFSVYNNSTDREAMLYVNSVGTSSGGNNIVLSEQTYIDSSTGIGCFVGRLSAKTSGQGNPLTVFNNSTDASILFQVTSKGTSSGLDSVSISAPLSLGSAGFGTAGYYLVSGGPSSPPTWVSTGGGTFNPAAPGPIGGTTPSTAAFTNISVNRSSGNPYIFWTEGTHFCTLGLATTSGTFFTDSAVSDMCIRSDSGRVLLGPGTGSTPSTAIVGTNGASNAFTVNGGSIASTKQSTGFLTPSGQGAYMGWNRSSTGVTAFYNQQGLGAGGWEWVGYNSSNVSTGVCMTLSQSTSSLAVSGNVSAANITSGTWTPSFFASPNSATFSTTTINYARYSISGKTVTISMDVLVSWSSANVSNCYLYCSGLPFSS